MEEEKEKVKKGLSKVLMPTPIVSNKKPIKHSVKSSFGEKSAVIERPIIAEKQI